MKRRSILTALAVPLLAALALSPLHAQQVYTLTDVATWTYGTYLVNPPTWISINASGQIAGTTLDATGTKRAFRWTPASPNAATGTLSLLALLKGATGSNAHAINNLGQVTGCAFNSSAKPNAVRWEANGTVTTLTSGAEGYVINDAGEVAGHTVDNRGRDALLWVSGKTYDLSGQGVGWLVTGINAGGQLVGFANTGGYLWTPTKPNGTSGSIIALPFQAFGINDAGQVVGGLAGHATIYCNGTFLDLGTVPGLDGSCANAINNKGQVVGSVSSSVTDEGHMMLWDSVHGMRSIDDPTQFTLCYPDGSLAVGWDLNAVAYAINDSGQIVGLGYNPAGQPRIFLLTPSGP
jgi:uncharacterized membrane protein